MSRFFSFLLLGLIALLSVSGDALAKEKPSDSVLGAFGHWRAYLNEQTGQRVCYMVITQAAPKTKASKRGAAYLMITHRPSEGSIDVVSYIAGYNFKPVDDVTVHVGKDVFKLFTQKDTAWTRDPRSDHLLSQAIRHNISLTITGMPATKKPTPLTDRFDLSGADKAYYAISKACGVETAPPQKAEKPKRSMRKTNSP